MTAEAFGLDTRSDVLFVRSLDPVQYQDGMPKVYNFSPIPRVDVYTLDRVEVLRGPSLAAVTLLGLVSGLRGEGMADGLSWLALGSCLGIIAWQLGRRR